MQQQVRGEGFEQCLARAGRANERGERGIGGQQRRTADAFGDQPHRALRHGVVEIGMLDGAWIVVGETAPMALGEIPG